jgi:Ni,Fe-hydrogenase III large subunit/Ni,Fe-hydrogenase III component G
VTTGLSLTRRLVEERPPRAIVELDGDELVEAAGLLLDRGYRLALVSAQHEVDVIRVVYLFVDGPPDQRIELHLGLNAVQPQVASLAHLSFPAGRFEREMRDLFGVEPLGHPQPRPLVLHQHWPEGWHPMRADAGPPPQMKPDADSFPFAEVEGAGIYEIPVGPVHAGVIEPGHFRFWVVGETIVRMKARLWFVHKGIERLFEGRDLTFAMNLAERISGDSAVGHSLAFCQAVEEAQGIEVSPRAQELRGVLIELERLYNHVSDVGALCNDVGFALANARALILRERLLELNESVTGHRLLRGGVRYGGAALRAVPRSDELEEIGTRFHELVDLARSNSIVMDRFTGTGPLSTNQAREIGVLGVVARASGLNLDARVMHPFVDFPSPFHPAHRDTGDVLARFEVRIDEVDASLSLLADFVSREGPLIVDGKGEVVAREGHGSGIVEGWRGAIVHRVQFGSDGKLRRVKVVDPSFFAWPALPVALVDTIVPDFPLVNKSFNLSYAGNDL